MRLRIAFSSDAAAGVFTLDSAFDGTDILSDLSPFEGAFDDVTDDVVGPVRIESGTDRLAGTVLPASLTVTVARPDDPGFWNPNNPDSSLNGESPGFEEMRPGWLTETLSDGMEQGIFYGFIRRAPWKLSDGSCQLYFEDLLFRASRVNPLIASTGPTTTGAAIGLILDAVGWTYEEFRSLATGDSIDDFSADGSQTALSLIQDLVAAERGTVFVRGNGTFVYESRDMPRTRDAAAPLATEHMDELESGVDADSRYTRVTVTRTSDTGDTTWESIQAAVEARVGRSEAPAVSSPYVPAAWGQLLADDIVYERSANGQPVVASVFATDDTRRDLILQTQLQSIFAIDDPVGGTSGDFLLQRREITIEDGQIRAAYTITKRAAREYTLDSALDGPDVFRY